MLKFLFILISFLSFLTIRAQQITNMKVAQEGDNVVITYDISSDKAGQTFDIKVECSDDAGKTFSIFPKSLTGDLKEIKAGSGKRIVWDVLSERQELDGDQFVFQLVAIINNTEESYSGDSGTFTDSRDGQVYKWVKIGTQIWMAENLRATKYRNGDPIQNVTEDSEWYNLTTGAYCNYNNDIKNAYIYGHLYNWYAVSDSRKIAPTGWHVASNAEWTKLTTYLGGEFVAGGKLKETGTTHWKSPNIGATNETGFAALPGGSRSHVAAVDKLFNIGYNSIWWSSSEYNTRYAWYRYLSYSSIKVFRYYLQKENGHSVRCVKD